MCRGKWCVKTWNRLFYFAPSNEMWAVVVLSWQYRKCFHLLTTLSHLRSVYLSLSHLRSVYLSLTAYLFSKQSSLNPLSTAQVISCCVNLLISPGSWQCHAGLLPPHALLSCLYHVVCSSSSRRSNSLPHVSHREKSRLAVICMWFSSSRTSHLFINSNAPWIKKAPR